MDDASGDFHGFGRHQSENEIADFERKVTALQFLRATALTPRAIALCVLS